MKKLELIDPVELESLEQRYGSFRREHKVLVVGAEMYRDYKKRKLKRRRAEIVGVVQRPDGTVLLHTKHSYPEHAYRLLSGGVDWREDVRAALYREMYEETGFEIADETLLGLLTYEFTYGERSAPFASFVFRVPGSAAEPEPRDDSEGISGFRWFAPDALDGVSASLRSLPEDKPGRQDWGRFRALAHDFVLNLRI